MTISTEPLDAEQPGPPPMVSDCRVDPLTGDIVNVVGGRQKRPNLPTTGCPFCVGGIEAPEPYEVKSFPNRFPPLPDARAEVILYSSDHDATFWGLGVEQGRKVIDLWADRSEVLGARDDVAFVMPFETRGPEVGATITHPHGQLYAFDHVPALPRMKFERGCVFDEPGERLVSESGMWRSWVPFAAAHPFQFRIAPTEPVPDLPSLDEAGRTDLTRVLLDALERLDRLFDARTPTMMWVHQRPFAGSWPGATLHIEIITPWRSNGVMRFLAAGEMGSREYFNTIVPEDAAQRLRDALPR